MTSTSSGQGIRLAVVSKNFGGTVAVKELSLEVEPGEFLFLLGPSGSGKTTLLRLIGGYEKLSAGKIEVGGQDCRSTAAISGWSFKITRSSPI